jgi:RHS repeat-associated protein
MVTPRAKYVYDAIYRLTHATGRELAGLAASQPDQNDLRLVSSPNPNDTQALRWYQETYAYDAVGNIQQMAHRNGYPTAGWTRAYAYETDPNDPTGTKPISNRLIATSKPGDPPGQLKATYGYDAHGNMSSMPHLPAKGWDFKDQLQTANLGGGGDIYFMYDAAGQRVRKVWVHNGLVEERIYVGGYEVYQKRVASDGSVALARQTLHVMDGVSRIALVETTTADTSVPAFQSSTVTRFQLGNHLGSAVLEVDANGKAISYEEYHPYGTTAYRAGTGAAEVSLKRYRYTGKERDEETGLYYHGARYYASWLGRWTSADPAGMVDGRNLYIYARNNPAARIDHDGHESTKWTHDANYEFWSRPMGTDAVDTQVDKLKATEKSKQHRHPVSRAQTIGPLSRAQREFESQVEAASHHALEVKELWPEAYNESVRRGQEKQAEALRQRASASGLSVREQAASERATELAQLTLMLTDMGAFGSGVGEEGVVAARTGGAAKAPEVGEPFPQSPSEQALAEGASARSARPTTLRAPKPADDGPIVLGHPDDPFVAGASKAKPKPGFVDVVGHGTEPLGEGFKLADGRTVDGTELAQILKMDPRFVKQVKPGMGLRFLTCYGGACTESVGIVAGKELGLPVLVSPGKVKADAFGGLLVPKGWNLVE